MFHSFIKNYQAEKYFGRRQKSFQRLACHQNKKKKKHVQKNANLSRYFHTICTQRVNFKQDYEMYKFQGINCRKLQVSIETTTKKRIDNKYHLL